MYNKVEPLWIAPPILVYDSNTQQRQRRRRKNIQFKLPVHNGVWAGREIISLYLPPSEEGEEEEIVVDVATEEEDDDDGVANNSSHHHDHHHNAIHMDVSKPNKDGLVLYHRNNNSSSSSQENEQENHNPINSITKIATCKKIKNKYYIYKYQPCYPNQQPYVKKKKNKMMTMMMQNNDEPLLLYLYATIDIPTLKVTLVNQPKYPKYQVLSNGSTNNESFNLEHCVIKFPKRTRTKPEGDDSDHEDDDDDFDFFVDDATMNDNVAVWNEIYESVSWHPFIKYKRNVVEIFQNVNGTTTRTTTAITEEGQVVNDDDDDDEDEDIGLIFYLIVISNIVG